MSTPINDPGLRLSSSCRQHTQTARTLARSQRCLTDLRPIGAPELCELRIYNQLGMTKIRKRTAVLLPPSMRSGENDQRGEVRAIARNRRFLAAINKAGKSTLIHTRGRVEQGWRAVARLLDSQGEQRLAESVDRFVEAMPPPRTESEVMIGHLLERTRARVHDIESTR